MIILLLILYAIALGLGIYGSYQFAPMTSPDGLKNFGVVATIVVAAISAVMTTFVSLVSLNKNLTNAERIERLKDALQTTREFNKTTSDAYRDLALAADQAHSLLSKLESASWVPANKVIMDDALDKAKPQTINCRVTEHGELWDKIRQRATFLAESAEELSAAANQADLWRSKSKPFSDSVADFKQIAYDEIRTAAKAAQSN